MDWTLVASVIAKCELAGKVYLVGGAVRDPLLGLTTKDFDLVVEKPGGARELADLLHQALPDLTSNPHELGRGYPIWQIVFEGGVVLEIADTQKEAFPDPLTRQRITTYGTLVEDCARRDFTVNMLYRTIEDGVGGLGPVVDPSGRGLADLQSRHLVGHPQVDPEKMFSDDPLRILRMIRFSAKLDGFAMDPTLTVAAHKTRERLKILSAERVRDELLKMCVTEHFSESLEQMRSLGLLEVLFPEFLPMIGCRQDPRYHSEGDVWVHMLMVCKNARATHLQQLTALLHDVGKPESQSFEGDRIRFIGHEKISVRIAKDFLIRWRFPKLLSEQVLLLIELHLRGGDAALWATLKPARKLVRDASATGVDLSDELIDFVEADSKSSLRPDGNPDLRHLVILREQTVRAREVAPVLRKPVLSGHEVMQILDIKSGPMVRDALEKLLFAEDEFLDRNKRLPTTDEARSILLELVKEF